ncbi:hypothetical protein [Ichthyenterobacterium magnum]|uniref:Uncharacterized protein n=1 Tax=Ichthyenterobacterium magnum TaxID=1230530 RepID=A0A420DX54_9FLAO|nr:hypothetical protein [Ichthyenterobacterium magnum]RKE98822.1 hypothetical protein BXY80_0917 [Ichthyenterobacterium magnum]
MNKDLPNNNSSNDEVELGQLFNAIGKLFERIFRAISFVFLSIYSTIIYAAKAVVVNYKIILIVGLVSGIFGYVLEKRKTKVYESSMLVRTYFDAKYQLSTNINYYNALIGSEDYESLSNIFNLSKEATKDLLSFEIAPGPETENDRIVQYDRFLKSIDSIRAQEVSFDDYIENRDIYSGDLFLITVDSKKKDIFKNLERGLDSTFKNQYSTKKMKKRDSMLVLQKENILASINEIEELKKVYVQVLENESESTKASVSLGDGFPLQQAKSATKEYELLANQIKLRDKLRVLDEKKIEENEFFDVISSFQEIGNIKKSILDRYSLIFPILSFMILCLIYLLVRVIKYVREYES